MNYEEKTVSSKHIFSGKIIDVDQLTVILPNGKKTTRDIVTHPGACAVVPIGKNGEIYMVRQFRKPIEMESLEIPAGKLDPGESPEVCAARELKEETGFDTENLKYIFSIHSTPGFSNEVLHIFIATDLKPGKACADEDEFISYEKYAIDDLMDMVFSGKITDAKSIIGIFVAQKIIKGELKY